MQLVRGTLLGIAYAVALYVLRDASSAHWYLPAGLRFAALLALPMRWWPYLYMGECASLLAIRFPLIPTRGLAWVLVSTFTAMPPVAALVALIRRRSALPVVATAKDVIILLVGALSMSTITTLINALTTYSLMHGRPTNPVGYVLGIWVLGQYLGMLIFAPLVLLWHSRKPRHAMSPALRLESLTLVMCACFAFWVFEIAPQDLRTTTAQLIRAGLGLAALALTYRHGWRGAAVGIVAASLGVGLSAGADYDPATLASQEMVAFVASALLLSGAAMTYNFEVAMERDEAWRHAREAGRRAWDDSEAQNLAHVDRAATVYAEILRNSENIVGNLRHAKRSEDIMRLTGDLLASTRSAANSLMNEIYPAIVYSADGLYGALRAKRFSSGVRYRTSLMGDANALSRSASLTAYRVATAALDHLAAMAPTEIRLRVRVARIRGEMIIYIRAKGDATVTRTASDTAAIARMRRRVMLLGGLMRNESGSLAILLPDSGDASCDASAANVSRAQGADAFG